MSGDLGPGDWVECITEADDDLGWPIARGSRPAVGTLYRVDTVCQALGLDGAVYDALTLIQCKAWSCDGHEIAWNPSRFRPIYRPSADLIETLKAPAPSERAPAHEAA